LRADRPDRQVRSGGQKNAEVSENGGKDHECRNEKSQTTYGRFDVKKIAESFPPNADTLLLDTYLTNEPATSSRVFRAYRPTPAHYHATCDEYLYVLSGKGSFWLESPHNTGAFEPGQLLFFKKGDPRVAGYV
jgi:mannose-6-phosphate isomerase-like protein (cupin superfamily)